MGITLKEGGHIHCMKKKDNIIKFKPKKPKPMKYWLCEFYKRYGEDENTYHYIFSDKNIHSSNKNCMFLGMPTKGKVYGCIREDKVLLNP